MPDLKLKKLPDRTPIKIVVVLTPDIKDALDQYADIYAQSYGRAEPVGELAAAIIEQFLAADRAFIKAKKDAKVSSR